MREFPTKTSQISLKHYSKDIFIKFSRTENHAHLKTSNFQTFTAFHILQLLTCDIIHANVTDMFSFLSLLTAACRKSNFSYFFLQFIFFLYIWRGSDQKGVEGNAEMTHLQFDSRMVVFFCFFRPTSIYRQWTVKRMSCEKVFVVFEAF